MVIVPDEDLVDDDFLKVHGDEEKIDSGLYEDSVSLVGR